MYERIYDGIVHVIKADAVGDEEIHNLSEYVRDGDYIDAFEDILADKIADNTDEVWQKQKIEYASRYLLFLEETVDYRRKACNEEEQYTYEVYLMHKSVGTLKYGHTVDLAEFDSLVEIRSEAGRQNRAIKDHTADEQDKLRDLPYLYMTQIKYAQQYEVLQEACAEIDYLVRTDCFAYRICVIEHHVSETGDRYKGENYGERDIKVLVPHSDIDEKQYDRQDKQRVVIGYDHNSCLLGFYSIIIPDFAVSVNVRSTE